MNYLIDIKLLKEVLYYIENSKSDFKAGEIYKLIQEIRSLKPVEQKNEQREEN